MIGRGNSSSSRSVTSLGPPPTGPAERHLVRERVASRTRRRTQRREARVLQAMVDGYEHAVDIEEEAGLAAGTVYPYLANLEGRGLIVSDWVDGPYPRRRRYLLVVPV